MAKERKLTAKQQAFVDAYAGNGTEAAIAAGYSPKSAEKIARELLRKTTVANLIREREKDIVNPLIASRTKRQVFWSEVMLNGDEDMRNRLKASELLGKSEGDFIDRVELGGRVDIASAIEEGNRRLQGRAQSSVNGREDT